MLMKLQMQGRNSYFFQIIRVLGKRHPRNVTDRARVKYFDSDDCKTGFSVLKFINLWWR